MNEITVSLYLYALIPLTDFNILFTDIDLLGWVVLCTIFLSVSVNIAKTVYCMGRIAVLAYRTRVKTRSIREETNYKISEVRINLE